MRGENASAVRRRLRSCNLLPNLDGAIASDRAVLRLVVSVANSWGNLRRLGASMGRFACRPLANRTRSSRCLDNAMFSWGTPAPAAQRIALSTRTGGPCGPLAWSAEYDASIPSFDVRRPWRNTIAEEC